MRAILSAIAVFALAAPALAQSRLPAQGFADLNDRLAPAVVNIATAQRVEGVEDLPRFPPGSPMERLNEGLGEGGAQITSLGSGFIISPDGVIITNNHVIESADAIEVILQNGQRLEATVVGRDPATDIAVLRVHARAPLPYVEMGDSDTARVGDIVLAIGNPFGLGGSLSVGVVSARNRNIDAGRYDDFIQTDAAINRGNSGGPLFNLEGEVIGVNTAIISPSGGSIGIGFAVPSKTAMAVIEQLQQFGETRRGWLGVKIQQVTDEIAESLGIKPARGALVAGIDDKGPAKPAGIESGDVIVQFDGKDIKEMRDLPRIVADTPVGKDVDVLIIRKGKEEKKTVRLGRLEDGEKPVQASARSEPPEERSVVQKTLGLQLSGITDELRKRYNIKDSVKGVVITGVDAASVAADKRLTAGSVIVAIEQEQVSAPGDVQKRVEQLKTAGKKTALLLVATAQGDMLFVALPIN